MATQKESFVFHFDYIEDVPEELQPQYAMYAINYARYGKEPELTDWRDIKMWNKTKQRIDEESEKYEKKCSNLKNHRNDKKILESTSNRDRIETESDIENEISSGDTESVSVSDCVTESESENESEVQAPTRETPSVIIYSKTIFEIFRDAGLPCARNNHISFLQRDFKNAMAYLHKTPEYAHLHSDDIIGACQNYARTVNNPQSFITGKYSFDRFVTFKNFSDFLPANYRAENFLKDKTGTEEPKTEIRWQLECPGCHQKSLAYSNDLQKYKCSACGQTYNYEEVEA